MMHSISMHMNMHIKTKQSIHFTPTSDFPSPLFSLSVFLSLRFQYWIIVVERLCIFLYCIVAIQLRMCYC